jgi:hypothetical protein
MLPMAIIICNCLLRQTSKNCHAQMKTIFYEGPPNKSVAVKCFETGFWPWSLLMVVDSSRGGLSMSSKFHETVRTEVSNPQKMMASFHFVWSNKTGSVWWADFSASNAGGYGSATLTTNNSMLEHRNLLHFVVPFFDFAPGFSRSLLPLLSHALHTNELAT